MNQNILQTKINKCLIEKVPDYISEPFRGKIEKIIYDINNCKNNSEEFEQVRRQLNIQNNCLILISNKEMKPVWIKFQKLIKKDKDLMPFYNKVSNTYNRLYKNLLEVNCFNREEDEFGNQVHKRKKPDLEKMFDKFVEINDILEKEYALFSPDGANWVENVDLEDETVKCLNMVDEEGNPPYTINWDIYMKDEDFIKLQESFNKACWILKNRIDIENSKRKEIESEILNFESRKKKIDGVCEIKMAKKLYLECLTFFKKPCYKEISVILNVLFGSPYQENEIVKFTKKIRDNIKKYKNIVEEEGFDNNYNAVSLDKDLFK